MQRHHCWRVGLVGWWLSTGCADVTVVVGALGAGGGQDAGASVGSDADMMDVGAGLSAPDVSLDTPDTGIHLRPGIHVESGTLDQFCKGRGTALQITPANGASTSSCDTRVEPKLFSYGMCACGNLVTGGPAFEMDSFDARLGPYAPGEAAAVIGVNGTWTALNTEVRLGSAIVAGGATIGSDPFVVAGDFKSGGKLTLTTLGMRVARDLWAAGDLFVPGARSFAVGRDAHISLARTGVDGLAVGGATRSEDFVVPPPCPCDPSFDVAALVAEAQAKNDNVAAGLAPNPFDLASASGEVALPCGRFAVSTGMAIVTPIDFKIAKRTALFIAGNVRVTSNVTFDPGTTGELDVFISGSLLITTASVVGSVQRPSALRLYIGDQFSAGFSVIAAQVYAPNSGVQLSGVTEFYGSLVAKGVATSGAERMHYDRAILEAGEVCRALAPASCDGCHQCPGALACVAGRCSPCARDADCCEPLVCSSGTCGPLLVSAP